MRSGGPWFHLGAWVQGSPFVILRAFTPKEAAYVTFQAPRCLLVAAFFWVLAHRLREKAVVPDASPSPCPHRPGARQRSRRPDRRREAELDAAVRQAVLHFGFDESSLTTENQEKLRVLADALRKRPMAAVRIAGHADERGTEEYNIALGQRRAAVARKYLVALGVPEKAIDTVSFGAERPAQAGHDEDAWAKNRRAETETLR